MKKLLIYLSAITLFVSCQGEKGLKLNSPSNNIEVIVTNENELQYSLLFETDTIVSGSGISISIKDLGNLSKFRIIESSFKMVSSNEQRLWGKNKNVKNNYNELLLKLETEEPGVKLNMFFRAYDDGFAVRYEIKEVLNQDSAFIISEDTEFNFTDNHKVWAADFESHISPQESEFNEMRFSDMDTVDLIGMPLLLSVKDCWVAITEANLKDFAGALLTKNNDEKFSIKTELSPLYSDTTIAVKTDLPAVSPWRVIMLGPKPGDLIESDIIFNLNDSCSYEDVSWIEPGVSAWDWWWSNSYAPSVDFELGPNQKTMKYFIDFAAEMDWEYQIVDWKWYGEPFVNMEEEDYTPNPDCDITTEIEGIKIKDLVEYANNKGVKLVIWLHWYHLERQMEEAMDLYQKWGVSGLKIDFMNRQDQEMVDYYHRVAREAAKRKMLVDFHGAYKPTGVSRKYPNLITREGVLGNEYNKWSKRVTPEHTLTLPFTRGLLGEMDFTPGAFRNSRPENFKTEEETTDGSPMSQTTRCHQLAMTVIYESAFNVFCDSPDNYKKGSGLDFLKEVPATWDQTKVLDAKVGDYIVMARRSGSDWYIACMTDASSRIINVDLSFLEDREYNVLGWTDAVKEKALPNEIEKSEKKLDTKNISVELLPGGGAVFIVRAV